MVQDAWIQCPEQGLSPRVSPVVGLRLWLHVATQGAEVKLHDVVKTNLGQALQLAPPHLHPFAASSSTLSEKHTL